MMAKTSAEAVVVAVARTVAQRRTESGEDTSGLHNARSIMVASLDNVLYMFHTLFCKGRLCHSPIAPRDDGEFYDRPDLASRHRFVAGGRMRPLCLRFRLLLLTVVLAVALAAGASRASAADAVTEWTLEADRLGRGGANWHTLAIMHQAMHDAANAVQPRYARWAPPLPSEPQAAGAMLEAAIAGAAAQVLVDFYPEQQTEIGQLFQAALRPLPHGPALQHGLTLGQAIGNAAVARRAGDGYDRVYAFAESENPGRWRPAPPNFASSNTTDAAPFLFASRDWEGASPPPALGSPVLIKDAAEVRRMGALQGSGRTDAQTYAAIYWAYQSSQRGFVLLAVSLLDSDPLPGGLLDHARAMSQLTAAMADSAIMIWSEKSRFAYWRPITVLQGGGPGIEANPGWEPLIETPPHPEYPSGHASDCFTGAGVLAGVFGSNLSPVVYVAQSGMPQADVAAVGMGQHAQVGNLAPVAREFATFKDAAQECALARIWAGAHFRSADMEAERLGNEIAARALAALPALSSATVSK